MIRVIHRLQQGSPEWHEHRAAHFNASELAVAMGISPHLQRSDLVRLRATGDEREVTLIEAKLFADGHEYEAMARPWAEEILGEELYPFTASLEVDGVPLSASYDGATMDEETTWEHKTLNQELEAAMSRHEIPEHHKPQLEQQLLILGAKRCLFMASNGSREGMRHVWYESDPQLRARIVAAWKQFRDDVANYQHVEVLPKATAAPIRDLPTLSLRVEGQLTIAGNLEAFGTELKAFVARIPSALTTDQDFADAEAAVKALQKAQDALESEEARALAQTESVDAMRRTVAEYVELARSQRLALSKLVEARKIAIRGEILREGQDAFRAHIKMLNTQLGAPYMPAIVEKFADGMKGKKTVKSLRDSVQVELARLKIEANEIAGKITQNLAYHREHCSEHKGLFADLAQLVLREADHFQLVVRTRIEEHEREAKAKAERLAEQDRERIRAEEEARARAAVTPAPAVAAMPPGPATVVTTGPSAQVVPIAGAKASRPTDDQIIATLALAYRVHESKVIEWLLAMDLDAASQRMVAAEFK